MDVISIIPARSGSKGIPNKNLKEVGGKSLLEWSIKASLKTQGINRTIVSTDSEEYALLAIEMGAEVPFLRPTELAQDSSPDLDFIRHTLASLAEMNARPDLIVHLRPTTPFRDPQVIESAIKEFASSRARYSALGSVHEMSESAYKMLEIDTEGQLMQIFTKSRDIEQSNMARQSFPATFSPNGYVDVLSSDFIEIENRIHGDRVMAFITERVEEVDVAADLEFLSISLDMSNVAYERVFGGPND